MVLSTVERQLIVGPSASLLLLCVGGSWALASPLGSTPDEDFHLGSIWCSHTARTAVVRQRTGAQDDPGTEHVIIPLDLAHQSFACFVFAPTCRRRARPDARSPIPTLSRANDGLYPAATTS